MRAKHIIKKRTKYKLIMLAVITMFLTGTYAIYKVTVEGRIQSNMATTVIDLVTQENNTFIITPDTTSIEYNFSINNYKMVDGNQKTNEVVSDYYIKINGITNNALTSTLYYIDNNNQRQTLIIENQGDYIGYYKALEQLEISNLITHNYVLKIEATGVYLEDDRMTVEIDIGYKQDTSNDPIIPIEPEEPVPNIPDLVDGMVPVRWNLTDSVWVKADATNANNDWYDYDNKKWANVALTTSEYRNVSDGTTIPESSILAMFVWIPRFVYRIPVSYYHKAATATSFEIDTVNQNVVDIHFSKTQAQGGDFWDANIVVTNSDTTANASDGWMTCPGFKFGNTQLNGLWIAKFQASGSEEISIETASVDNVITDVYIKPSRYSEKSITMDNMFNACRNMETSSIYGWSIASGLQSNGTFEIDSNELDSHLIKNSEWSATAFFMHSKYGINKSNIDQDMSSSNGNITGISTSIGTVYGENVKYSSTGNVYGIYDLSNTIWDCVAGYIYPGVSQSIGSIVLENAQDKYKNAYNVPNGINYTITYTSKDSIYGLFEYINGASIWETSSNGNASSTAWFAGRSNIGIYSNNKYSLILARGGSYTNNNNIINSVFSFGYAYGNERSNSRSFRPVIAINSAL